jgi:hypothetical protein
MLGKPDDKTPVEGMWHNRLLGVLVFGGLLVGFVAIGLYLYSSDIEAFDKTEHIALSIISVLGAVAFRFARPSYELNRRVDFLKRLRGVGKLMLVVGIAAPLYAILGIKSGNVMRERVNDEQRKAMSTVMDKVKEAEGKVEQLSHQVDLGREQLKSAVEMATTDLRKDIDLARNTLTASTTALSQTVTSIPDKIKVIKALLAGDAGIIAKVTKIEETAAALQSMLEGSDEKTGLLANITIMKRSMLGKDGDGKGGIVGEFATVKQVMLGKDGDGKGGIVGELATVKQVMLGKGGDGKGGIVGELATVKQVMLGKDGDGKGGIVGELATVKTAIGSLPPDTSVAGELASIKGDLKAAKTDQLSVCRPASTAVSPPPVSPPPDAASLASAPASPGNGTGPGAGNSSK